MLPHHHHDSSSPEVFVCGFFFHHNIAVPSWQSALRCVCVCTRSSGESKIESYLPIPVCPSLSWWWANSDWVQPRYLLGGEDRVRGYWLVFRVHVSNYYYRFIHSLITLPWTDRGKIANRIIFISQFSPGGEGTNALRRNSQFWKKSSSDRWNDVTPPKRVSDYDSE